MKKYLVGVSMILASAAAFAQPNSVTETGSFINNTFYTIHGMVQAKDYTDNAYITIAGETIPSGAAYYSFDIAPGKTVSYSINLTSLNNTVIMRLNDNSGQFCYWNVLANTMEPVADPNHPNNPPVCKLIPSYDYAMINPYKK